MTDPTIRASITVEDLSAELLPHTPITIPSKTRVCLTNFLLSQPTFDPEFANNPQSTEPSPNFRGGTTAWCLDKIVKQNDLHSAGERIKKNKHVYKTLRDKLLESNLITAGRFFKAGSYRIGKTSSILTLLIYKGKMISPVTESR